MKFLLPLILLIVGTGGGVGAAMFLAPPEEQEVAEEGSCDCHTLDHDDLLAETDGPVAPAQGDPDDPEAGLEYARLNNQFIVPVVEDERVSALVVLSLSIEVAAGSKDLVFQMEPRLRDGLLQVMFDHANVGGFDGVFTASDTMGSLRAAMRNIARQTVGPEVTDVLILDVVRQEVPG